MILLYIYYIATVALREGEATYTVYVLSIILSCDSCRYQCDLLSRCIIISNGGSYIRLTSHIFYHTCKCMYVYYNATSIQYGEL